MKAIATCILVVSSISFAQDTRRDVWETTDFVWDFGIVQSCSHKMKLTPLKYFESEPTALDISAYDDIRSGGTVWVQCRFLRTFYEKVLPVVTAPFVLVMSDGDETFPADCGLSSSEIENLLSNEKVIHLFAQNYDYKGHSAKVSRLPIGMDFHTPAYKGIQGGWGQRGSPREQEHALKDILKDLSPTSQRKPKAFVDFQLSDTMRAGFKRYLQHGEDRASIFEKLRSTGLIDHDGFMPRTELWKRKGQYAFSISPHGNGLDCHRTWEDLVLGCIVIVKTSSLDPLYEGLPVVIVGDWSEITRDNLDKWLLLYGDAFENPSYREKLTHAYWWAKIQNKSQWITE